MRPIVTVIKRSIFLNCINSRGRMLRSRQTAVRHPYYVGLWTRILNSDNFAKAVSLDSFEVMERLDSLGYGPETEVQCHLDAEFMSLSISAFVLRLVCTNGLVAKSDVSASYRHVSTKILSEFPQVMDKVSYELGTQRSQFKLSMESPVDDPESTLGSFNRQFGLNASEKDAVTWAWPMEMGDNMFAVVNTYTRAAQWNQLTAESSFRLARVGGNILGMLN